MKKRSNGPTEAVSLYVNQTYLVSTTISGSKFKVENYRPISVTSKFCGLMEKIIRNALVNYLENNNKFKHGFRKSKSCTAHLLECIEDWTSTLDEINELDIIYSDFKAAFDRVPHKRY